MTLTFPRTDLFEGIRFARDVSPFRPLWRQQSSRTAGGEVRIKTLGPLLWQAEYRTVPMLTADAVRFEARLLSLKGGAELFEGWDPRNPYPAHDAVTLLPDVTVHDIRAARDEIRITGMPDSFELTEGDWLSVDDGDNLHLLKIVESATIFSSTHSDWFAIQPPLHPSASIGDPVNLRRACGRFMLRQETVTRTPTADRHETVSFEAIQVIE